MIRKTEKEYLKTNKNFIGKAFVSFDNEDMKERAIKEN